MKINNELVFRIETNIVKLALDYNGTVVDRTKLVNGLATNFEKLRVYTENIGTGCVVSINKFFESQKAFEAKLQHLNKYLDLTLPAKCVWEPLRKYSQETFAMLLNMYSNTDISENEFKKLLRKIGK